MTIQNFYNKGVNMKEIEGYPLLANAIIEQACTDYRKAKVFIKKHTSLTLSEKEQEKLEAAKKTVKRVLEFFSDPAFEVLTKANPTYILNKLNRELEEEDENGSGEKSKEKV